MLQGLLALGSQSPNFFEGQESRSKKRNKLAKECKHNTTECNMQHRYAGGRNPPLVIIIW